MQTMIGKSDVHATNGYLQKNPDLPSNDALYEGYWPPLKGEAKRPCPECNRECWQWFGVENEHIIAIYHKCRFCHNVYLTCWWNL